MRVLKELSGGVTESSARLAALMLLVFMTSTAWAATQGPLSPTTCANTPGIGTKAWAPSPGIPESVGLDVNLNQTSNYLQCTGYGFAIPSGATINGITVTINRRVKLVVVKTRPYAS